jgi:hypothetical protein
MKTKTKWIIGVVAVVLLLIIISNLGKKGTGTDDFSGIDTRVDVEQPADLEDLQAGLDALQQKINELEAEDLVGLSS